MAQQSSDFALSVYLGSRALGWQLGICAELAVIVVVHRANLSAAGTSCVVFTRRGSTIVVFAVPVGKGAHRGRSGDCFSSERHLFEFAIVGWLAGDRWLVGRIFGCLFVACRGVFSQPKSSGGALDDGSPALLWMGIIAALYELTSNPTGPRAKLDAPVAAYHGFRIGGFIIGSCF